MGIGNKCSIEQHFAKTEITTNISNDIAWFVSNYNQTVQSDWLRVVGVCMCVCVIVMATQKWKIKGRSIITITVSVSRKVINGKRGIVPNSGFLLFYETTKSRFDKTVKRELSISTLPENWRSWWTWPLLKTSNTRYSTVYWTNKDTYLISSKTPPVTYYLYENTVNTNNSNNVPKC